MVLVIPSYLTNAVVSATQILCNVDQCLSNCRIMVVTVSAESFPGPPKYRPHCRHMGSRKALNLAGNSGPLREMFDIQCFGRLGPLFATKSFRSDSLATDSPNLVSAYGAIEKADRVLLSTDRADERLTWRLRVPLNEAPGDSFRTHHMDDCRRRLW
jgi:hypothetical protein